jgi:hypothetical protein
MNLLDLARAALGEQPSVSASPVQTAELRELIPMAFPGISQHDFTEIFPVACADAEAALTSFRLLAQDTRERATWGH